MDVRPKPAPLPVMPRETAKYFVCIRTFQHPFEEKGATVYVKEGDFFRSQGGLTAKWGTHWTGIDAESIDDARLKAHASEGTACPGWHLQGGSRSMSAKLNWITPDAEAEIVKAARVSTTMSADNPGRLIAYLIEHRHWSPFEMASASFKIVCSRAVGRQILRHRSFSFQEFSQRYSEVKFMENLPFRVDHHKNRQSSVEITDDEIDLEKIKEWNAIQDHAKALYTRARALGVAKELARVVAPEGLTEITMFMTGTIRSWIHYLELRTKADTQQEHRHIAVDIGDILADAMPNVMGAAGI